MGAYNEDFEIFDINKVGIFDDILVGFVSSWDRGIVEAAYE